MPRGGIMSLGKITLKGFNDFEKELLEFQREVTMHWQEIIDSPMDERRGIERWALEESE